MNLNKMLYKRVELKEGVPVQFVGVYVTKWQKEWGQPTVGFVEDEAETINDQDTEILKKIKI